MSDNRKKLILHSCCGPCSTAVIERLVDDFDLTVFYYNPNITNREEYEHRRDEEIRFINEYSARTGKSIKFIEGRYDTDEYYKVCKGLEQAPEGGNRCLKCFEMRLRETIKEAEELSFDCFDTTLTVSPYKNFDNISRIAKDLAEGRGVEYLGGNYKKRDGYKRSIELSKEYGLYRQHFCGCEFSQRAGSNVTVKIDANAVDDASKNAMKGNGE